MKLSPQQQRVWTTFQEVPFDTDVPIAKLYERMGKNTLRDTPSRVQQQRVGSVIARINALIAGKGRIEPGRLKRTYRLSWYG